MDLIGMTDIYVLLTGTLRKKIIYNLPDISILEDQLEKIRQIYYCKKCLKQIQEIYYCKKCLKQIQEPYSKNIKKLNENSRSLKRW